MLLLLEIHATEATETVSMAVWAARFAADVSNIVVMERKHTATLVFTANRDRNIFKGYYHNDVLSRNNSLYSNLSPNTAQKRYINLISPFLLKLFFNTILIKTKSPTIFFSHGNLKWNFSVIRFITFFINKKLKSCYRKRINLTLPPAI